MLKAGENSILTLLNRILMPVIQLVVVLFLVDKSYIGFHFIGVIPFIGITVITVYISKLEKKAGVETKVNIIGWICFFVTAVIGLVLILSCPEIFNTYGI